MSFVAKLFGIDTKAQKRAAEAQAAAIRESADSTKRQSQAIADQSAQQARLAQERSRVEEQVRLMQEQPADETPTVDIGDPGTDESPTRRRRAYQNPGKGPSGSVRI